MAFGFGAGGEHARRESHISINVAPTSHEVNDTPEIRKYKKRFNSEILCASLWGELDHIFFFCGELIGGASDLCNDI